MSAYQLFTSSRVTVPDPVSLVATLRASLADATVGVQVASPALYRAKKATPWSPTDVSTTQAAIDAAGALTPQVEAQYQIDGLPIFLKALALTLLDQINVLRTNAGLATVTPAQALAAIRAKAGTL